MKRLVGALACILAFTGCGDRKPVPVVAPVTVVPPPPAATTPVPPTTVVTSRPIDLTIIAPELKAIEDLAKSLDKRMIGIESQISGFKDEVAAANKAAGQVSEFRGLVQAQTTRVDSLNSAFQKLEGQVTTNRTDFDRTAATVSNLNASVAGITATQNELRDAVAGIREQIASSNSRLTTALTQLDTIRVFHQQQVITDQEFVSYLNLLALGLTEARKGGFLGLGEKHSVPDEIRDRIEQRRQKQVPIPQTTIVVTQPR
jgi:hypothetical protein